MDLSARGVTVSLVLGRVQIRAPVGVLAPGEVEALKEQESAIRDYLASTMDPPENCCLCGSQMPPGLRYRCSACAPSPRPLAALPSLMNGALHVPSGYLLTQSLYDLAVSLGMNPDTAARRYAKPRKEVQCP